MDLKACCCPLCGLLVGWADLDFTDEPVVYCESCIREIEFLRR